MKEIPQSNAALFEKLMANKTSLYYEPTISFSYLRKLTTDFGIVQSIDVNQLNINSGYTLSDNAQAMIIMCNQYESSREEADLSYIYTYFNFIKYCFQEEGYFFNYVDQEKKFTEQNNKGNLADANGKAIWALGYLVSLRSILPLELIESADTIIQLVLFKVNTLHSTRAMAFAIKGLYYYNIEKKSDEITSIIKGLANRLIQMYRHTSDKNWDWFESYMTYANAVLPESLLCAYHSTGDLIYKEIAKTSFHFLLAHTFNKDSIKLNPGNDNLFTDKNATYHEDRLVDYTYMVLALAKFHKVFNSDDYLVKMEKTLHFFLEDSHLQHIIYTGQNNTSTRSTLSYLMAGLTLEKYFNKKTGRALISIEQQESRPEEIMNDKLQEQKRVA